MATGNSVIMHNTFLEVRGRADTVVGEFAKRNSAPPRVFGSQSRTSQSLPPTRQVASAVPREVGYASRSIVMAQSPPTVTNVRRVSQDWGIPASPLLNSTRSVTVVQPATAREWVSSPVQTYAAPPPTTNGTVSSLSLPAGTTGLPLQTLGYPGRVRTRTRTSTMGSRGPAGSFDVPMTPESRWYPNGPSYSFGMPQSVSQPPSPDPQPASQPAYAHQAGGGYMYAMPEGAMNQSNDPGQAQWARMPNGVYVQLPSQAAMSQYFPQQQMGQVSNTQAQQNASAQRLRLASLVGDARAQPQMTMTTNVSSIQEDGPITTVMLRNIPLKYTRDSLMQDLAQRSFAGTYDFFYLPIDFQSHYSVGYAFINFVTDAEATRFRDIYQGLRLADDSLKVCEVCNAKVQGRDRNVEQYRNSAVMTMEEQYHPIMLQNGMRMPFPAPSHAPKPFRPRRDRRQQQQGMVAA